MSYQAWLDTVPSNKQTTYSADIILVLISNGTHRRTKAAGAGAAAAEGMGAEKLKTTTTTSQQKQHSCLCVTHRIFNGAFGSLERHAPPILLFGGLLLAGICKQARQGTHYIHVPCSPACHKLPFPSLVCRQLIRQQWALQPASDVSCELRTNLSLSHFLSLPRSCFALILLLTLSCSPSLPLSRSHTFSFTLSSLALSASSFAPCLWNGAVTVSECSSPCLSPPAAPDGRPFWPPSGKQFWMEDARGEE